MHRFAARVGRSEGACLFAFHHKSRCKPCREASARRRAFQGSWSADCGHFARGKREGTATFGSPFLGNKPYINLCFELFPAIPADGSVCRSTSYKIPMK